MTGMTVNKRVARISNDNLMLVINIIVIPTSSTKIFLTAIDTLVPTKICTMEVSLLMRDRNSPLCFVSKNSGLWTMMCE